MAFHVLSAFVFFVFVTGVCCSSSSRHSLFCTTEAESRIAGSLRWLLKKHPWPHLHEDYVVITSVQQILEMPSAVWILGKLYSLWVSCIHF
ncbi:hypothetical protein QL285_048543 [Trifolium repens]|nr:hypothetical protein QL285_048543 [Trifolium repens]